MEREQTASHLVRIATNSALELLRIHTEQGASGEFIYAGNKREIHVFVQRGRVAWATDSGAPVGFARALGERSGASEADVQSALEEARAQRCSLGETLTKWNIATWSDVRWALERHLINALCELARGNREYCMFLSRRPAEANDGRLTFAMDELLLTMPIEAFQTESTGTYRTARVPRSVGPRPSASISANDTLLAVRGAERVEVLRGNEVIDSAGRWVAERQACLSMLSVLDDGASLIAAHSSQHSLVGAALRDTDERVWMYLGHAVALSAALAPLADRIVRSGPGPSFQLEVSSAEAEWSTSTGTNADLRPLFAHPEVIAAIVENNDGDVLLAQGRAPLSERDARAIVERRLPVLQTSAILAANAYRTTHIAANYRVATREANCWCLGAIIPGAKSRGSVWMITHTDAGLAIGWACLSVLARAIVNL